MMRRSIPGTGTFSLVYRLERGTNSYTGSVQRHQVKTYKTTNENVEIYNGYTFLSQSHNHHLIYSMLQSKLWYSFKYQHEHYFSF